MKIIFSKAPILNKKFLLFISYCLSIVSVAYSQRVMQSENSELKKASLIYVKPTAAVAGYKRFIVLPGISVDVRNQQGVIWETIGNSPGVLNPTTADVENYINASKPFFRKGRSGIRLAIKDGQPVMIFSDGSSYFYGDIIIDGNDAVLGSNRQVFEVNNFRKVQGPNFSDETVEGGRNTFTNGGAKAQLGLSANDNGDIIADALIEFFCAPQRTRTGGVTFRYRLKDVIFKNLFDQRNDKKAAVKRYDSIRLAEDKIAEERYQRELENSIKDSKNQLIKKQRQYVAASPSCLKFGEGDCTESYYVSEPREHYYKNPSTGGFDTYTTQEQVMKTRSVPCKGLMNTCDKVIYLLGTKKMITKAKTVYWEDVSIRISPGHGITKVNIDNTYDPDKADIGSIHYYYKLIGN